MLECAKKLNPELLQEVSELILRNIPAETYESLQRKTSQRKWGNIPPHKLSALAKKQNEYLRKRYSTKDSQYEYELEKLRSMNWYINVLFMVYLVICMICVYVIIVGNNFKDMNKYKKGFFIFLLFLFPYVMTPLEGSLLNLLSYILKTITGETYDKSEYQYVLDSGYLPGLPPTIPMPEFLSKLFF
jgi:hypothetical protein